MGGFKNKSEWEVVKIVVELDNYNKTDHSGNVTGGYSTGMGMEIHWQDGALYTDKPRNGALVDEVLQAALQRLEAYQETRLSCFETHDAITKIQEAMQWLEARRRSRQAWGVQGTYKP